MTDDGYAEYNVMKGVYPKARCFLCTFHVAQAVFHNLNCHLPESALIDVMVDDREQGVKRVEKKRFGKEKLKFMAMGSLRGGFRIMVICVPSLY